MEPEDIRIPPCAIFQGGGAGGTIELEGDYSTWSLKWSANYSGDVYGILFSNDRVIVIGYNGTKIFSLADGSLIHSDGNEGWFPTGEILSPGFSVLQKYVVTFFYDTVTWDLSGIRVWETLISGIHIISWGMSPDGKYIGIADTNNDKIYIFEGE